MKRKYTPAQSENQDEYTKPKPKAGVAELFLKHGR